METKWQANMLKGNKALNLEKLTEALEYFDTAVNVAESELQMAEAFHALALTNLKMDNTSKFFESERLAARYYAHFDVGQAADFMKYAGDVLMRLKEHNMAARAYCEASKYFGEQSLVEKDEDLRLAWIGWSHFCNGKSGEGNFRDFGRAADAFLEAASVSESGALQKNRKAKAHLATALSILFDSSIAPFDERLLKSKQHLREALNLEPTNPSFTACYLAIVSLTNLTKLQKSTRTYRAEFSRSITENVDKLRQVLGSIDYTCLLVEELDRVAKNINFDLLSINELQVLNDCLLETIRAVS